MEHLEELRRRILWALAFIGVAAVGCWIFSADLYQIASQPIGANPGVTLSISRPQDIFSLYVKVTLVAAIFVSAPFVLVQAWMFVSPNGANFIGLPPGHRVADQAGRSRSDTGLKMLGRRSPRAP